MNADPVGVQELESPRFKTTTPDSRMVKFAAFKNLIFWIQRRSFERGLVDIIDDGKLIMVSKSLDMRPHVMNSILGQYG